METWSNEPTEVRKRDSELFRSRPRRPDVKDAGEKGVLGCATGFFHGFFSIFHMKRGDQRPAAVLWGSIMDATVGFEPLTGDEDLFRAVTAVCIGTGRFLRAMLVPALTEVGGEVVLAARPGYIDVCIEYRLI